jgi:uncharacterized surface protein with fasciclin (FAS1) repeats
MATIMDVLEQDGSFSSLVTALKKASLDTTLRGKGPYTIFAPTEDAVIALPDRQFFTWQSDMPKLTKVLNFHILAGRYSAADLLDYHFIKTLEGQRLRIGSRLDDVGYADSAASDAYGYVMGGTLSVAVVQTVTVNGAAIVRADIPADNGFVHAIDHVLVPWLLGLAR